MVIELKEQVGHLVISKNLSPTNENQEAKGARTQLCGIASDEPFEAKGPASMTCPIQRCEA